MAGIRLAYLRAIRERHAFMSQAELARRSGLSANTIWRLETGRTRAHGATVRRLAEALGVRPEELAERRETS